MTAVRTLSSIQAEDIRQAVQQAEHRSGLRFAVYLGSPTGGRRHFAERLHAGLGEESANAVLIYVDPSGRALEIVTGERARGRVPDGRCRLIAMSMATAFSAGDLTGGVVYGVSALMEVAGRPGR